MACKRDQEQESEGEYRVLRLEYTQVATRFNSVAIQIDVVEEEDTDASIIATSPRFLNSDSNKIEHSIFQYDLQR